MNFNAAAIANSPVPGGGTPPEDGDTDMHSGGVLTTSPGGRQSTMAFYQPQARDSPEKVELKEEVQYLIAYLGETQVNAEQAAKQVLKRQQEHFRATAEEYHFQITDAHEAAISHRTAELESAYGSALGHQRAEIVGQARGALASQRQTLINEAEQFVKNDKERVREVESSAQRQYDALRAEMERIHQEQQFQQTQWRQNQDAQENRLVFFGLLSICLKSTPIELGSYKVNPGMVDAIQQCKPVSVNLQQSCATSGILMHSLAVKYKKSFHVPPQ